MCHSELSIVELPFSLSEGHSILLLGFRLRAYRYLSICLSLSLSLALFWLSLSLSLARVQGLGLLTPQTPKSQGGPKNIRAYRDYEGHSSVGSHVGGCQNYGPFLDPFYNTAPKYSGYPTRDHNFDNHPRRLRPPPSPKTEGSP